MPKTMPEAPRPLTYGRQSVTDEDIRAVVEVLRGDWLTQGPTVERFERALAERVGARHAVAVSSGTAALHLAVLAAGVAPGDRVLTTPNTFVATANAALYAGATPEFVDIDPQTLCIDPERAEKALTDGGYRAVLPVHFAGYPAAMERIFAAARARGTCVIEDASHALGTEWRDGQGNWRRVGGSAHADMTTLSFHPVKQITTAEGGAVLTDRDDLADRLRRLRTHGITRDAERLQHEDGPWYYEMQELGFNYRISDLQCALGLSQLDRLDRWLARRAELVARYRRAFETMAEVRLTRIDDGARPAWHLMVVQVPRRERVFRRLRECAIQAQVHYIPVHLQPYYRNRFGCGRGDFPHSEAYYDGALSLPLHPGLSDGDVDRVIASLAEALEATR